MSLHLDMFLPALESQSSPEQKEKWLEKACYYDIIGTYAQTELGHGEIHTIVRLMLVGLFWYCSEQSVINM